jgi:hypothetical protein
MPSSTLAFTSNAVRSIHLAGDDVSTSYDDAFHEFRSQGAENRRTWLRDHIPRQMRAQWWWALLERAQAEIRGAGLLAPGRGEAMVLAVEIVESAINDGMPDYLAASWFARMALTGGAIDNRSSDTPEALEPDHVARRILGAFGLTRAEAIEEAARRRQELLQNDDAWFKPGDQVRSVRDPSNQHVDPLQKIEYLTPELELVAEHIRDPQLAAEARAWLTVREQLEIGDAAARRGHELLARWRGEQSTDARRPPSGDGS